MNISNKNGPIRAEIKARPSFKKQARADSSFGIIQCKPKIRPGPSSPNLGSFHLYFELDLVSGSEINTLELNELVKFFGLYSSLVYTALSRALSILPKGSRAWLLRFGPG